MGTDQGKSTNFIYVWNTGSTPPVPDSKGRFPNRQDNANAAIPVYEVTTPPADTPPYPNNQGAISNVVGAAQGAMPVKFVAKPTPDSQGRFPTNPTNVNSAIPVWVVAVTPGHTPPYPNSQAVGGGATPVYVVA